MVDGLKIRKKKYLKNVKCNRGSICLGYLKMR